MNQAVPLTDQRQRNRNILRATEAGMFLQAIAADEIEDRLSLVNRRFKSVAIVTVFPDFWQRRFPDAQIINEKDVLQFTQTDHDLVIHSLGLHWANDPVGQLIQCRRVLQPDGLFLCATLGGQTLHELRSSLAQAEVALSGGLSPRVVPMAEIRDLGALLQRAGFALPVADIVGLDTAYADIWHLMQDLREMGEANALLSRLRKPTLKSLFETANDTYAKSFPAAKNRIKATFEMILLTGWAPSETQQKPLRPGSAAARLADALGSDETSLPD